ncbi:hypothetical protein F4679DRAFT_581314 [Xylaria curta]|nr:hypothetical protein F4679DRAFT_581314 [Xylaria curta]
MTHAYIQKILYLMPEHDVTISMLLRQYLRDEVLQYSQKKFGKENRSGQTMVLSSWYNKDELVYNDLMQFKWLDTAIITDEPTSIIAREVSSNRLKEMAQCVWENHPDKAYLQYAYLTKELHGSELSSAYHRVLKFLDLCACLTPRVAFSVDVGKSVERFVDWGLCANVVVEGIIRVGVFKRDSEFVVKMFDDSSPDREYMIHSFRVVHTP